MAAPTPTPIPPTPIPPTATPIPTAGATPTVPVPTTAMTTPTPMPAAGHTIFSVSVCLHGIANCGDSVAPASSGNMNPNHTQRKIAVTITANGNVLGTQLGTVIYNAGTGVFSGNVDMGNLASGTYTVSEKVDQYISKQVG